MEGLAGIDPIQTIEGAGEQLAACGTWQMALREAGPAPAVARPGPGDLSAMLLEYFQLRDARLRFQKDELSGKWVAQVIDVKTGEVLRQVPPEELRRIAAAMRQSTGLLVNRRG